MVQGHPDRPLRLRGRRRQDRPRIPRDPAEIAQLYATYEDVKRDRSLIDFEDVLLLTVGILQDRHDIADQVRSQYQHFVVDEYQDVSPLQQRLLELWLGERDSLCVVGDASQTIYSFTGATPDHLLDFRTRHPAATVVKLVRDYRSSPQVVHLANGLLSQARGRAADHRLELISQRAPGPEPVYAEYTDEPAEAEGAARRIRDLIASGIPAGEIAVLFRTNSQSEIYEQALADAGVPYQLRGAERFFDRPEVRKAGAALRAAARFGANDSLLDDVVDLPSQVRAVLSGEGWTGQPPCGSGAVRERWESLAALVHLAQDFAAAKQDATLGDLVAELDERAGDPARPDRPGRHPRLPALRQRTGVGRRLPRRRRRGHDADHLRKDRRADRRGTPPPLRRRHPRQRTPLCLLGPVPLTRRQSGPPTSRFLDGLRPGSVTTAGRTSGGGPGGVERGIGSSGGTVVRRTSRTPARCRVCGRTLTDAGEMKLMRCEDCPSDMDEGLYERLREWRTVQAQRSGQPAFCVFTDKTLMAIAETVPDDEGELARIPGVGVRKLNRFGVDVLAICAGQEPGEDKRDD